MKKKIMFLLMTAAMVIGLCACGGKGEGPEGVVESFIDNMKKNDYEAMNNLLADPSTTDFNDFMSENQENEFATVLIDYVKDNASDIEYKITGSSEDGDSATVNVDLTYKDASVAMQNAMSGIMEDSVAAAADGSTPDEDALMDSFIAAFKEEAESADIEKKQESVEVKCVKKDSEWVIESADGLSNAYSCNLSEAMGSGVE